MRTIKIKRRVFCFNVTAVLSSPSTPEDINPRQWLAYSRLCFEGLDDRAFICEFFGIKSNVVKEMSRWEIYNILQTISEIIGIKMTNVFYFPKTAGLKAPEAKLEGVTLERFAIMDTMYYRYLNNESDKNLARFVASVALREGEKITDIDFEKRTIYVMKRISKEWQKALVLNYIFIKKWLSNAFKYLFEEKEETNNQKQKKQYYTPDWNSVIDSLTAEDILRYDEYIQMPCIRAFKLMNARIKDYKQSKK